MAAVFQSVLLIKLLKSGADPPPCSGRRDRQGVQHHHVLILCRVFPVHPGVLRHLLLIDAGCGYHRPLLLVYEQVVLLEGLSGCLHGGINIPHPADPGLALFFSRYYFLIYVCYRKKVFLSGFSYHPCSLLVCRASKKTYAPFKPGRAPGHTRFYYTRSDRVMQISSL